MEKENRQALISVFDKAGVAEFALALQRTAGFGPIISTGGTATHLLESGVKVCQVTDITGFPEILDGRVKSLHPRIHAGLLANTDLATHREQLKMHKIDPIQIVVVNLYPFVERVINASKDDRRVALEEALELVDIGGSALIRAAAKNFPRVIVIVDPQDLKWVAQRLSENKSISLLERQHLALKAFQHSSNYDASISAYLASLSCGKGLPVATTEMTDKGYSDVVLSSNEIALPLKKKQDLRYGENPHQKAALFQEISPCCSAGITGSQQLHGPEMSFNNYLDADAALQCVREFSKCAAVIIKHTNPCGFALGDNQQTAYQKAFKGDPVSAYGGIVAFNRKVEKATAEAMHGVFFEVVLAPAFDADALAMLQKRAKLRILEVSEAAESRETPAAATRAIDIRRVTGGLLVQQEDVYSSTHLIESPEMWKQVALESRKPSDTELRDLAFAWRVCKHVKSNAIVLARDEMLSGIGCGQPNRLQSIHLAVRVANANSAEGAKGCVLASDAFMPFADNVEEAAKAGVTCIVQPGGSIRDQEVITAANANNMLMMFTGTRHFKH